MDSTVLQEEKRILLFEDSDIFADMVLEFLTALGYTTARAVNGFEGIKAVFTFKPHLIITDVEMPLFKGYQATRLLKSRKSTKDIPIIMFTSLNELKDKFWGNQAGADWYIEKSPENFSELRSKITQLLSEATPTDFVALERDGKRIDDNALIETVNNLLDAKLFQTTVIGMLAELSAKLGSLEDIAKGFFDLLNYICQAEIVSLMIKGADNSLMVYTANIGGFNAVITDDFNAISIADFDNLFPDFQVVTREVKDFYLAGEKKKRIESYIMVPLLVGGEKFATVHIGNSIKEYFSPTIRENMDVFLNAAAPIISNALSMLEMEELQKKTRVAFARYVPADVIDEIIHKSSETASLSETRNLVVFFLDIRNFTKISENSSAQDLVNFLNKFFSAMGNEIIAEGGHIDKFIGDSIMAIFGAPRSLPNAPACAIRAAIRMIRALQTVDTSHLTLPESGLAIGIGINSGECVVGNIGFQDRMDYTVIGDNVNLASRLEGVTKMYHHPIIVSENMYEAAREQFIFRKIDTVRVKGKNNPVGLYAVYIAFAGEEGAADFSEGVAASLVIDRDLLDNYEKGLRLFYMREWETAKTYFNNALRINGEDYFSTLYLERIEEYSLIGEPMDDAVTLTEK
ncbi:putative adenylate cyclase 2 (ATP pyrophosphate-lyase 2) (Adenylylcyclase 2) (AC2) [Treponema primitia ZAS-2]|uniref:Putative adenylate cyclase 2 (ATP pyrophosphate-lyase 2) (Adenylylcyclase 2) (AC2) n=1 Tax=Treponema primitia (strain ATCC BAA-887 / DSM 12427 / ZAS-2) TaxID=545694 RepID=F5YNP0_TREPZ|nr:adenylate/guanylate cyclase domain-containing protein [Treponema primitia]AEF84110.1 putative adenylate cyclase 2 (ATP pyrophosphate-lyase 2) (Adenylylcyclase 2) (AC2) [Treponema primitia ZAS-2]